MSKHDEKQEQDIQAVGEGLARIFGTGEPRSVAILPNGDWQLLPMIHEKRAKDSDSITKAEEEK